MGNRGRGKQNDDALSCQKYGVPLYGAAWVPSAAIAKQDSETPPAAPAKRFVVLSRGGGEGHSGIPSALLLSAFDSESNSLSDQPVAKQGTSSDLPYRMGVHPGGKGILCSFPKSCRARFRVWEIKKNKIIISVSRHPFPFYVFPVYTSTIGSRATLHRTSARVGHMRRLCPLPSAAPPAREGASVAGILPGRFRWARLDVSSHLCACLDQYRIGVGSVLYEMSAADSKMVEPVMTRITEHKLDSHNYMD